MKDEIEEQRAIDEIKKKLKKQKEKTKIAVLENKRLNSLLDHNDEKIHNLIANQEQEIKNLRNELQHKLEEFELKEHNYKNTIDSLTQRNENLKNDLNRLKKEQFKPKEVIQIADPNIGEISQSSISSSPQRRSDSIQIMQDQYMARIKDLTDQVNAQKQKREE